MRIIIVLYLGLLITGCDSPANKEKNTFTEGKDTLNNDLNKTEKKKFIKAERISAAELPAEIKFRGTLQEAWQWNDDLGDNILITSLVPAYADKKRDDIGDDAFTAELHAFHFLKKDASFRLLWKISDAERSCPFDITAAFMKDATTVTDLDSDGIAETAIQYKISCRSDVSPDFMKLILHEDTLKYSLRGMTCEPGTPGLEDCVTADSMNLEKQPPAKDEWEELSRRAGRYESEKEFSGAPPAFLSYARKQWLKYVFVSND